MIDTVPVDHQSDIVYPIYAYGQVLKPAAFEPGTGLATNYHVMAESATRTVLRLEGTPGTPGGGDREPATLVAVRLPFSLVAGGGEVG